MRFAKCVRVILSQPVNTPVFEFSNEDSIRPVAGRWFKAKT